MNRQCPSQSELRQFLLGELHRSVAYEIEEHFACCDNCLKVAEQLDKAGELLGDLELRLSENKSVPPDGRT